MAGKLSHEILLRFAFNLDLNIDIAQLCYELGVTRRSAWESIQSLCDSGYVEKIEFNEKRHRYVAGPRLIELQEELQRESTGGVRVQRSGSQSVPGTGS